MAKPKLPQERELELVRRYEAGVPPRELAVEFQVSKAWIPTIVRRNRGKVRVVGGAHSRRKFSESDRALAASMRKQGATLNEIRSELGCGMLKVSALLRELGFELRGKGYTDGTTENGGYRYIRDSDQLFDVMRNKNGYILEHRAVMARKLGRPLDPLETVHHIDGNKQNNCPENLQLRIGRHGKNECYQCRSCGSRDIQAVPI